MCVNGNFSKVQPGENLCDVYWIEFGAKLFMLEEECVCVCVCV